MTRERREEVVLVALVLSLALHIGLMVLVKSQAMTRAVPDAGRRNPRGPMRVVKRVAETRPASIEELIDLKAKRDAPALVGDASAPRISDLSEAASAGPIAAHLAKDADPMPTPELKTSFEVRPAGLASAPALAPMTRIETPKMSEPPIPAPEFSMKVPDAVSAIRPAGSPPPPDPAAAVGIVSSPDGRVFTPSETVYETVDAAVVEAEKSAVRELVDAADAAELTKFVNLTMTSAESGGWRYFKVMMTPRTDLKTVPKDVVIVIDGSGSIGNDRLGGCRKAARRIMRSCMNTGDRFNLVVFRNAFSYAFRSWRECDAASFEAGDRWLGKQTAHGRTDVFSTISSVLTLPRDPKRPLIALVVTDGDANSGVSDTAEILSRFTELNDGLISVYMYGVKSSANRELIDVLTHGNRGESFVFEGWRWDSGEGMEELSERFRDPVLGDLRIVFATGTRAEAYPRLLRNLYRGGTLEFVGRVPSGTAEVAFSLKGLNGANAYESFFRLPFSAAPSDPSVIAAWNAEAAIDRKLGVR